MEHWLLVGLLKLCGMGLAVYVTGWLLPGVQVRSFRAAVLGGVVYSVLQVCIGWLAVGVLTLLLGPVGGLVGGLVGFLISAGLLWLMSVIVIGIEIDGFKTAVSAALVLWGVNLGLYFLLGI